MNEMGDGDETRRLQRRVRLILVVIPAAISHRPESAASQRANTKHPQPSTRPEVTRDRGKVADEWAESSRSRSKDQRLTESLAPIPSAYLRLFSHVIAFCPRCARTGLPCSTDHLSGGDLGRDCILDRPTAGSAVTRQPNQIRCQITCI